VVRVSLSRKRRQSFPARQPAGVQVLVHPTKNT